MSADRLLDDVPQYWIVRASEHERMRFELANLLQIFFCDGKRLGFRGPSFFGERYEERTCSLKNCRRVRSSTDRIHVCSARDGRLRCNDCDPRFVLRRSLDDSLSSPRTDHADNIKTYPL